jgi:hypothetical protein
MITNLDVLSDRISLSGQLDNINPVDRVNFSFPAASPFSAGVTGLSADVTLRLFRAGNTFPIALSKQPGPVPESINLSSLSAGSYYLEISHVGNVSTPYTLKLANRPFSVIAENQDFGSLAPQSGVHFFSGFLYPNHNADQVRFHLDAPSNVNLALTGLMNDLDLWVFREDGNGFIDSDESVGASLRTGSEPEVINLRAEAGDYIVHIQQPSTSTSSSNYVLKLAINQTDGLDPSNIIVVEQNLGVTSTITTVNNTLSNNNTSDIYKFTITTPTVVNIFLQGNLGFRVIQDFNLNGIIESNPASGQSEVLHQRLFNGTLTPPLNAPFVPGIYFLQVFQQTSGIFLPYTLRLWGSSAGNLTVEANGSSAA